jgi:hypothetical protein
MPWTIRNLRGRGTPAVGSRYRVTANIDRRLCVCCSYSDLLSVVICSYECKCSVNPVTLVTLTTWEYFRNTILFASLVCLAYKCHINGMLTAVCAGLVTQTTLLFTKHRFLQRNDRVKLQRRYCKQLEVKPYGEMLPDCVNGCWGSSGS